MCSPPRFAAPDGGDTTFFGGNDIDGTGLPNFFGTSAAAAHAGAVGHLLRQANGGRTPDQVYTTLADTAHDITLRDSDLNIGGTTPLPAGPDADSGRRPDRCRVASTRSPPEGGGGGGFGPIISTGEPPAGPTTGTTSGGPTSGPSVTPTDAPSTPPGTSSLPTSGGGSTSPVGKLAPGSVIPDSLVQLLLSPVTTLVAGKLFRSAVTVNNLSGADAGPVRVVFSLNEKRLKLAGRGG